jgi:hypothetical protein
MLVAYGTLTLSEQSIAIHRLVISESSKFPEIGSAFHELAIRRANEGIAAWLRRQCEPDSSCSTIHRRLPECCAA